MSLFLDTRTFRDHWSNLGHPFLNAALDKVSSGTHLKENLLELSADRMLLLEFKPMNLDSFWLKRKSEYREFSGMFDSVFSLLFGSVDISTNSGYDLILNAAKMDGTCFSLRFLRTNII